MRLASRLIVQLLIATVVLVATALFVVERRVAYHLASIPVETTPVAADSASTAVGDNGIARERAAPDLVARAIRRDVVVIGLVTLLVGMLVMRTIARRFAMPVEQTRAFARHLVEEHADPQAFTTDLPELNEITALLRQLHAQRRDQRAALTAEESQFTALTDALQEGVVAVDARRQVFRVNQTARTLLRLQQSVPFSADMLPRDSILLSALHTVLAGGEVEPGQVHVGDRVLSLAARPLPAGGALLAFYDSTPFRRLESVRRDFVANVSHELRTPLTVVRGAVETLQDEDMPTEIRSHFLRMAESNVLRMQRIVDDLLDLSRIESGGWLPDPVLQDIAAVANEIAGTLTDAARHKNVNVRIDIADDATHVFADPTAIRQIFSNLAENALRHTDVGEVVLFSARANGNTDIGVRDTGSGIDAVHLPRIFERFYRADPSRSREGGGTGLGLAIVRHLTEAHGGTLRAESLPRVGTTITATFPDQSNLPTGPQLR